jgi:hypothetical protein
VVVEGQTGIFITLTTAGTGSMNSVIASHNASALTASGSGSMSAGSHSIAEAAFLAAGSSIVEFVNPTTVIDMVGEYDPVIDFVGGGGEVAFEVNIGGNGSLFVGEDKLLRMEVVDDSGKPVNMAGVTILLDIRKTDDATEPAIVSKVGSVTGAFDPVRGSNAQRVLFLLTDDDMNLFYARNYRHSVKSMDTDFETLLAYGYFTPQKATAP